MSVPSDLAVASAAGPGAYVLLVGQELDRLEALGIVGADGRQHHEQLGAVGGTDAQRVLDEARQARAMERAARDEEDEGERRDGRQSR